jgi:hypothetical protein
MDGIDVAFFIAPRRKDALRGFLLAFGPARQDVFAGSCRTEV